MEIKCLCMIPLNLNLKLTYGKFLCISIVLRVFYVNLRITLHTHESLLCQSRVHASELEVWLELQKLACSSILFIKFTSWVLEVYTEGKACTRCLPEAKEPKNETLARWSIRNTHSVCVHDINIENIHSYLHSS